MIATLAFYVFSVILLASAAMVVSARNPVHSVLFLILSFSNAAALFLIAGAEFLAMILLIVYVGAVAVLFLFVVMMLDVDFAELRGGFQRYLPVCATVGAVLFIELALVLGGWKFAPDAATDAVFRRAVLRRRRHRAHPARSQNLAPSEHPRADRAHRRGHHGAGDDVAGSGNQGGGDIHSEGDGI